MTVRVLGPVQVEGWAKPPTRARVTELLVYLALHPGRSVPAERLRTAVWPYDPHKGDVALGTVHQEVSRLRSSLGTGHLPEAKGGYRLAASVECDWCRFEALCEAARAVDEAAAMVMWRDALSLVRGRPFEDVPARAYSWAFDEVLVARMEAAVAGAAHQMAKRALAAGNPVDAGWAVRQGLAAVPADEQLWADRLRVAAASEGQPGLDRAWRDVERVMGEQAEGGALRATYTELRKTT